MKQIVFLISAFVVLLQLHSTTAADDSQSQWKTTQSTILDNTDKMKDSTIQLKETGETAWKNANLEVPSEWARGTTELIELLDVAKTIFTGVTDEGSKASSIVWAKIAPEISDVVSRISLAFKESEEKVKNAVSGTQQEINAIAVEVLENLGKVIKTETLNTVNIVRAGEQKVSNAEKSTTDSQDGWDEIKAKIQANIEALKEFVKIIKEAIDSKWKKAGVQAPANWAKLEETLLGLLDQALIELGEFIDERSRTSSLTWEAVQKKMDEIVTGMFFNFYEYGTKVKVTVSSTDQEIQASVDKAGELAKDLIKTETLNARNILDEAAQENSDAEQTAAGSGSPPAS